MQEEMNYYSPELEEFYVGFECEILNGFGNWFPIIIDKSHLFNDIKYCDKFEDNLENSFRVKVLDKTDIESLGWKETLNNFFELISNPSSEYSSGTLLSLNDDNTITLYYHHSGMGGPGYHTRLSIKNKSELKKLMKQLGI